MFLILLAPGTAFCVSEVAESLLDIAVAANTVFVFSDGCSCHLQAPLASPLPVGLCKSLALAVDARLECQPLHLIRHALQVQPLFL